MEKRYNVMIVEDDAFIRKVLRQSLHQDFEVISHINAFEAMDWLEKGNPVDIILTAGLSHKKRQEPVCPIFVVTKLQNDDDCDLPFQSYTIF